MTFQIINVADHVNAGIDKINENFEQIEWTADSGSITNIINQYMDSDLARLSDIIEVVDSDYIQSIIATLSLEGNIDSAQVYSIIAQMGLVARLDSVDGGFVLLAQDFTHLQTAYENQDANISALSNAYSVLTSQRYVLASGIEFLAQAVVELAGMLVGGIVLASY